jgi:hypothetical protein
MIGRGADRTVLASVTVSRCWGDGFYIGGGAREVSLLDCTADSNRRQGLSIVHAVDPLVSGGRYVNTGQVGWTAPSAGIDVEPNPLRGESVTGARIRNVVISGNRGPGLLVVGVGGPVDVHASDVVARRNGGYGFSVGGSQARASLSACLSELNHTGFVTTTTAAPTTISTSRARGNSAGGFVVQAARTTLEGCEATGNAGSGFEVRPTSSDSTLTRCRSHGNSTHGLRVPEVDVSGPRTAVRSMTVTADRGARASCGIALRASAAGTVVVDTPAPTGFAPGLAVLDQRPVPKP